MTYTTKRGETWDEIAKSQLGSEEYMGELIEANREYVETAVFDAGTVLTVPENVTAEVDLPAWRM